MVAPLVMQRLFHAFGDKKVIREVRVSEEAFDKVHEVSPGIPYTAKQPFVSFIRAGAVLIRIDGKPFFFLLLSFTTRLMTRRRVK